MDREFLDPSSLSSAPLLIPPGAGDQFDFGAYATHWKIDGSQTGGRFAVVHHPLMPHTLGAPLHRHHREDEYSYVLTGTFGALLGDAVVKAQTGTWVFKPRGQWHTFWNEGDAPCEIIEVISPAGFENYWRELRTVWPDRTKSAAFLQKYELDVDFDSVPKLCARFGLIRQCVASITDDNVRFWHKADIQRLFDQLVGAGSGSPRPPRCRHDMLT